MLERKDYAFMTCNLEDRADSYAGQCEREEVPRGRHRGRHFVAGGDQPGESTAAKEPVLKQFRFQKLCHSICYCGRQGWQQKGVGPRGYSREVHRGCRRRPVRLRDVPQAGAVRLRGLSPRELQARDTSTCKAVSSRRKLLQEGAQVAESVRPHFHKSHHDMHMTRANVFGKEAPPPR